MSANQNNDLILLVAKTTKYFYNINAEGLNTIQLAISQRYDREGDTTSFLLDFYLLEQVFLSIIIQ